jgi:hypothetical protein
MLNDPHLRLDICTTGFSIEVALIQRLRTSFLAVNGQRRNSDARFVR